MVGKARGQRKPTQGGHENSDSFQTLWQLFEAIFGGEIFSGETNPISVMGVEGTQGSATVAEVMREV